MKATRQHKDSSGRGKAHQTSYPYRISIAVAKVVKMIIIFIGALTGLLLGWIIRRIFKAVGWLISAFTMLAILYWLLTAL